MQFQNTFYRNCLIDAIDLVLSRDIPDELLADAVTAQAALMARVNPEDLRELDLH